VDNKREDFGLSGMVGDFQNWCAGDKHRSNRQLIFDRTRGNET
jgi:hypothetical protein